MPVDEIFDQITWQYSAERSQYIPFRWPLVQWRNKQFQLKDEQLRFDYGKISLPKCHTKKIPAHTYMYFGLKKKGLQFCSKSNKRKLIISILVGNT